MSCCAMIYKTKVKPNKQIAMSKQHVSAPVFVCLIVLVIASLALGVLLRDLGKPMIYCIIPIAIALLCTVAVDGIHRLERRSTTIFLDAYMNKKISEEEYITYLLGITYNYISQKDDVLIKSALELNDPELMAKAKDILNDPELIRKIEENPDYLVFKGGISQTLYNYSKAVVKKEEMEKVLSKINGLQKKIEKLVYRNPFLERNDSDELKEVMKILEKMVKSDDFSGLDEVMEKANRIFKKYRI